MRSALLVCIMCLTPFAIFAQMGMGPQTGTTINMTSTEVLAPAAGRGPGAAGSLWRTDLWVKGIAGTSVVLEFHPVDASADAPTATAQLSLTAGIIYLPDVLKSTFNLEQSARFRLISRHAGSCASPTAAIAKAARSWDR